MYPSTARAGKTPTCSYIDGAICDWVIEITEGSVLPCGIAAAYRLLPTAYGFLPIVFREAAVTPAGAGLSGCQAGVPSSH